MLKQPQAQLTNATPLVSIYIPTKDRPQLLRRALASCLQQSYQQLEIIVVDDGSAAEFQPVIDQLCQQDARIRLVRNATSLGAPASRNRAITQARGMYITGLDDDDEFTPQRVQGFISQRALLDQHAFLCSGYQVQQQRGRYRYAKRSAPISLQQLLFANHVGSQIFTLTQRLQQIGGFDPQLSSCQDYDTWLRLVQQFGPGFRLAEQSYILHQDHTQSRITDSPRVAEGYQRLLAKHQHLMSKAQYRTQCLNLKLLHGQVSVAEILTLPLSQQWRFFKVLAVSRLNTIRKGKNS